jgi:hypothetical protein
MKKYLLTILSFLATLQSVCGQINLVNRPVNTAYINGVVNFSGVGAPVITVTSPSTTCTYNSSGAPSTDSATVTVTWNANTTATSVRGVGFHGGYKFNDQIVDNSFIWSISGQLTSGNSFSKTFRLPNGIYTLLFYRDPNDDNITNANAPSGIPNLMDDYAFGYPGPYSSPNNTQQICASYGLNLLPQNSFGLTSIISTTNGATDCYATNGRIVLDGMATGNYDIAWTTDENFSTQNINGSGKFTINNLSPGIYPVNVRRTGQACYRKILIEVPSDAGRPCYSSQIDCGYTVNSNAISGADFGGSALTNGVLPTNGITDFKYVPRALDQPQDSAYSFMKSTLPSHSSNLFSIPGNYNNYFLRYFNYTARQTHTWGCMQSTLDHTGSTNSANGTTGGWMMVVNGAYPQGRILEVSNINLVRCAEYEFSVWIKNIQPYMPGNKNNTNNKFTTYAPLLPIIGLGVEGKIYNVRIIDTLVAPSNVLTRTALDDAPWYKIGIRFKSPATNANGKIVLFNYQQGGVGNDFVIDDVFFARVTNPIQVSGSNPVTCGTSGTVSVNANINCAVLGNSTYQWQVSNDYGVTFANTGASFNVLPNSSAVTNTSANIRYRVTLSDGSCIDSTLAANFLQVGMNCILDLLEINVRGNKTSQGNILNWEINKTAYANYFLIERSSDGINFFPISNSIHATNSTSYAYTDNNIITNTNYYYRVKAYSNQNNFKYSNLIKLQTSINNNGLQVLQNPVKDVLQVMATVGKTGQYVLTITNTTGQIMFSKNIYLQEGVQNLTIKEASILANGNYTLSLNNFDENKLNRLITRFIK